MFRIPAYESSPDSQPTTAPLNAPATFDYGIERQPILNNRAVMLVRGGDMRRQAVDCFAAELYRLARQPLEGNQHIYILMHMAHPKQGFTPYGHKQVEKAYDLVPPDKKAFVVALMPNSFIFRMVSLFAQHRKIKSPQVQAYVVTDEQEALNWLQEKIEQFG